MFLSPNIPINTRLLIAEIHKRQGRPWNDGRINDYEEFPLLQQLFQYINSGIPQEDFFYQGPIYRIHTPYIKLTKDINKKKEFIAGPICLDGSCRVLPYTEETNKVCAFSKSFDFTSDAFSNVYDDEMAIFLFCNTNSLYGIDVCILLDKLGEPNRLNGEQEVLFPIQREFIIKEYQCYPNQFKEYIDKTGT